MIARTLLAVGLAVLTALPGAANAAPREQNFGAHLTGEDERPTPRQTSAQGQATFHLNADGTVDYHLVASNIDNVVAAHIHCSATEEETAPAIVHLATTHPGNSDGVNSRGTFDGDAFTCDDGKSVIESMRAGLAYVNVHTNDGDSTQNEGPGDFPGGEIRGQIEPRG
jgi:hypothetical protein